MILPSLFPYSYIFIPASFSLADVKINAKSMFVPLYKTFLPKKENFSPQCEHRDQVFAVWNVCLLRQSCLRAQLEVVILCSFVLLYCDCVSIKDTDIEREPLSSSLILADLSWQSTRTIASSGCESFLPADSNHQLINSWCAGLQKHDCY